VRHENPDLEAELNEFIGANKRGSLIDNVLFKRYYGGSKWISNPLLDVERSKLGPYLEPLQRHCAEFGFDWRLIAAQAFQESRLDPTTVSSAGAVGLMQLLPSTAADMGVTDPGDPERGLYAGIKYMDWLRRTKFDEPQLSAEAQLDFCLAAYNAGATRVRRWRTAAPGRGLDPDLWFGNVELLALEDVGMEPLRYVGNINKYYILFAMSLDSIELSREARATEERAALEATKKATTR
jgi:membrane-bound lytic murein transglycosylase MltF